MDDTKEKPDLMRVNDTLYIDRRGRQFSVGTAEVTEATRDNRIYIPMHADDVAELERRRSSEGAAPPGYPYPGDGRQAAVEEMEKKLAAQNGQSPDPKKSAGNQDTAKQEAGARQGGEPQNGKDQGPAPDKPNNA